MRSLVPLTVGSVVLLAALGGWVWNGRDARSAGPPAARAASAAGASGPLTVDVHRVTPEAFEVTVPATGTLLARESVELVSELSRRLVRVRADEGSTVKKGQVLFELDASDVEAELRRVDVQIRLAKTNAEREKALLAEGLTTRQRFDSAEAELEGLHAQRAILSVTLSKTRIRAPFDGTLGLRKVSEGAWLSPNTVLAALQDTSTLKLDFTLPERYSGLVGVNRDFRFRVTGRSEVFRGKVVAFEPAVDAASRSLIVRGVVENSGTALMPGTFATVELPLRVDEALLIPSIAVIPGAEGRRVFVVQDDVVRSRPIELGARTADRVQVSSGLAAGDRVVINNLLRVRDGTKVKVRAAERAAASPERAQ